MHRCAGWLPSAAGGSKRSTIPIGWWYTCRHACYLARLLTYGNRFGFVFVFQVRCVDSAGKETCCVKGSVEAVLSNCTHFQGQQGTAAEMGEEERRRVLDAAGALGSKGRRYG